MSRSIGGDELERFITEESEDVNALMSDGNTALYHALLLNNKALTKILLDRGADIYVQNSRGITPLDLALHPSHITESGSLVVYSYMQRGDFNPDAIIAGTTLLQILLYKHGTTELVKDLLARGTRYDIPDSKGETALDFAVKWNNPATEKLTDKGIEIIKKHLSQESVDVNAKLFKGGRTLLHAIIEKNSDDMLQLLLSKGARYDIPDSEGQTALNVALIGKDGYITDGGQVLVKTYMDLSDFAVNAVINSSTGGTLLHALVKLHRTEDLVQDLLTKGARYDIQDSKGKTALEVALIGREDGWITDSGQALVRDYMSRSDFDVNAVINTSTGETLLHALLKLGKTEDIVQNLLTKGARYDIQDSEGKTALDLVLFQQSEGKINESGRELLAFKAQKDVLASASASAVSASELLATEEEGEDEDDDEEDLAEADASDPSATVISPAIPVPDAAVPSAEAGASVEIAGDHQE